MPFGFAASALDRWANGLAGTTLLPLAVVVAVVVGGNSRCINCHSCSNNSSRSTSSRSTSSRSSSHRSRSRDRIMVSCRGCLCVAELGFKWDVIDPELSERRALPLHRRAEKPKPEHYGYNYSLCLRQSVTEK